MSVIERIYKIIEDQGVSVNEFSKKVGVSNGYFAKQKTADANIGSQILEKIVSEYPLVNPAWLLTGKGDMNLDGEKKNENKIVKKSQKSHLHTLSVVNEELTVYNEGDSGLLRNIPVLDQRAAAGWPYSIDDPGFFKSQPTFSVPKMWFRSGEYVLLQVDGDSMHDTLYNGDWIFISHVDEPGKVKDGYIYVVITADGTVVKRVISKYEEGYLALQSDNSLYPTYTIKWEEVIQIWKVERVMSSILANRNKETLGRLDKMEADIAILKRQLSGKK